MFDMNSNRKIRDSPGPDDSLGVNDEVTIKAVTSTLFQQMEIPINKVNILFVNL